MADLSKLDDHPGLADWYRTPAKSASDTQRPSHRLVRRLCECLSGASDVHAVRQWLEAFSQFLGTSKDPLREFLAAEGLVQDCDADFLDLLSEFGEAAVRTHQASNFFATMQRAADATGLVALRFLAAWTALNTGHLEQCVDECDKIDEPFSSIFTIQGQALLELGRVSEAIEALAGATKLAPSEILAWFQLAKAYHVADRHTEAFGALEQCRKLAPQSEEVALFMAMVAAEPGCDAALGATAFAALEQHLERMSAEPVVIFALLRLALRRRDKQQFRAVVAGAQWPQASSREGFVKDLSEILRALHEEQWMDVAGDLLARVVPRTATAG
jgi:tetratricopeptide (TPR) repeat protein